MASSNQPELVRRLRRLVKSEQARRIRVYRHDRVLMDVTVPLGVGGVALAVLLAPKLTAIAALVTLLSDVRIRIDRPTPDAPPLLLTPDDAD